MPEFRPGDLVKCIDAEDINLTKNGIYKIKGFTRDVNDSIFDSININNEKYFADRFELYNEIKPGDMVQCFTNEGLGKDVELDLNELYTVQQYSLYVNNKEQGIILKESGKFYKLSRFIKVLGNLHYQMEVCNVSGFNHTTSLYNGTIGNSCSQS